MKPYRSQLLRDALKKRGGSAHFEEEMANQPDHVKLMALARESFDEARAAQKTVLLKAAECGEFLHEAKCMWKVKSRNRWLKRLKAVFGKARRTAQEYMQIASEWGKIEPLLVDHPDLSVAGALRYIRTGKTETPGKRFDSYEYHLSREWRKLKEMWGEWPEESRKWLRNCPDLLEELLFKLVRENAEPEDWWKYVPREKRHKITVLSLMERRERAFKAERKRILARFGTLFPEPTACGLKKSGTTGIRRRKGRRKFYSLSS